MMQKILKVLVGQGQKAGSKRMQIQDAKKDMLTWKLQPKIQLDIIRYYVKIQSKDTSLHRDLNGLYGVYAHACECVVTLARKLRAVRLLRGHEDL